MDYVNIEEYMQECFYKFRDTHGETFPSFESKKPVLFVFRHIPGTTYEENTGIVGKTLNYIDILGGHLSTMTFSFAKSSIISQIFWKDIRASLSMWSLRGLA